MLRLMQLWAQLHRQSLFGISTSKSESCWMNLSSHWPTAVWLQLRVYPYQLIIDCCNQIRCNRAVVLHVYWCITMMMAIAVIMIVKWDWCLDTFNGLTTFILVLRVMLGVCSCVTMSMQISVSTRLVLEVLHTLRHQLYKEHDVAAAFLPHQGQPFAQGLIVVTTLVTNVVFILWHFGCSQDWWQLMSMQFLTLAGGYCCFL